MEQITNIFTSLLEGINVTHVVQGIIIGGVLAFITAQLVGRTKIKKVNGWSTMYGFGVPGNGMLLRAASYQVFPGPVNVPQEAMYWTCSIAPQAAEKNRDRRYALPRFVRWHWPCHVPLSRDETSRPAKATHDFGVIAGRSANQASATAAVMRETPGMAASRSRSRTTSFVGRQLVCGYLGDRPWACREPDCRGHSSVIKSTREQRRVAAGHS